jgi:acyl-CoA reductase-like NAD-dependent aldehyde dehydrogenase
MTAPFRRARPSRPLARTGGPPRSSGPIYTDLDELVRALGSTGPEAAPPALHPDALDRLDHRLRAEEERLRLRMSEETGYTPGDAQALLDEARRFLRSVRELPELHRALTALETERYAALTGADARIELAPWGTCLVCTPSNAPAPLALAVPLALAAAGNRVVVTAAPGARNTALGLAELVAGEIGGVFLWGGHVRPAVFGLLAAGALDLVYFVGGTAHYPQLAAECARAGAELIYEGEGAGVAVLDELDPAGWKPVVDALVAAKSAFLARMRSAPCAIAVPRALSRDFDVAWARSARSLPAAPRLVRGASLAQSVERDLFRPIAYLVEYDDWDALARELAGVRHRLQLSIFSASDERIQRMVRATRFARYCINQCPIAQDPLLPGGNYGLSGSADVLDFYRKGLRRIILERGTLLAP